MYRGEKLSKDSTRSFRGRPVNSLAYLAPVWSGRNTRSSITISFTPQFLIKKTLQRLFSPKGLLIAQELLRGKTREQPRDSQQFKMKTNVYVLVLLSALFASVSGLNHRVQVFLKKSSGDIGTTVEMRTRVQFFGPNPSIMTTSKNGLAESTNFPGNGEIIFDEVFVKDPISILVTVTESDGSSTADDGVCKFLAQPSSWPIGIARFQCLRESTNGLDLEWWIIVQVNSFEPIP